MNIWLNSAWMFVVLSVVAQGRPDAWLTIRFPHSPLLHFLHITCHLGLDLFHKPNKGLALVVILCQLTFNAKQQMSLPCGCGHAAVSQAQGRQHLYEGSYRWALNDMDMLTVSSCSRISLIVDSTMLSLGEVMEIKVQGQRGESKERWSVSIQLRET